MAIPSFYAAVYAIIRDTEGRVLFSQRKNTGFMDGKFQLPAGHIDGNETVRRAMVRELFEELGIEVAEEDAEIVHVSHRLSQAGRIYFDIYLTVSRFVGTPRINEPDKCSDLRFVDIQSVDFSEFVGYDVDVLRMISEGKIFSEIVTK